MLAKGKTAFIPFDERKAIVSSIKYVDQVIESPLEDSDAYDLVKYDYLFVDQIIRVVNACATRKSSKIQM